MKLSVRNYLLAVYVCYVPILTLNNKNICLSSQKSIVMYFIDIKKFHLDMTCMIIRYIKFRVEFIYYEYSFR